MEVIGAHAGGPIRIGMALWNCRTSRILAKIPYSTPQTPQLKIEAAQRPRYSLRSFTRFARFGYFHWQLGNHIYFNLVSPRTLGVAGRLSHCFKQSPGWSKFTRLGRFGLKFNTARDVGEILGRIVFRPENNNKNTNTKIVIVYCIIQIYSAIALLSFLWFFKWRMKIFLRSERRPPFTLPDNCKRNS